MARITYRKTRKGETITMRADKGEDLRNVVAEMTKPASRNRNRDGRYSHNLDALCICGHTLGQHTAAGPDNDCLECSDSYLCDGFFHDLNARSAK